MADSVGIPISTVYLHLVEKIGFKNDFLRSVPHMLTEQLRQKRVKLSRQWLELRESQRGVNFRDIVTGDGPWFLQHYENGRILCLSADEVPQEWDPRSASAKLCSPCYWASAATSWSSGSHLKQSLTAPSSAKICLSRSLIPCTTGEICTREDRYYILTMPHLIDQPIVRIVSMPANSVMLSNLRTAPISVHATSFYSAIWKSHSKLKNSRHWKSWRSGLRSYLVS
jgi:hypothetical protein